MKDNNFVNLGKRIREKRLSQNLTQEALAEKADVGTTHISHIETGCTKLSLTTFISIAMLLMYLPMNYYVTALIKHQMYMKQKFLYF